jgi:DNA repair protein RecO (recombination protein O)
LGASLKVEALVLRSIRYGEADRIIHAYTPNMGRIGAIAKGVRRARSKFGGRLEPFSHVALLLHEGRGDLHTVTGADTISAHAQLRTDAQSLDAAARACDAVLRLFDTPEGNPPVFHLLTNEMALLDGWAAAGAGGRAAQTLVANQLAFRLKLLLAAGFAPALGSCAACGTPEHLVAFSGAHGGVVCGACEAGAFPLSHEAHEFMAQAMGSPLASAPQASERALRQAERAISETVEHHGHVRLRAAAAG